MKEGVNSFSEASDILGLYKAEWLNGKLFDFFNEPGYFNELKTARPCVLIGGRGTGKTTVLRGLSYQGQFALRNKGVSDINDWSFFGLYLRINTNRVTAFRGPELSEDKWGIYFAHYINLSLCQLMLEFAIWYQEKTNSEITINKSDWRKLLATLNLQKSGINSLESFQEEIEVLLLEFEAAINTVIDTPPKNLSMQGAPIDALASALLSSPQLRGKQFFFLIDEYENFEDYQQKLLNTIIKHSNSNYTFKIGVRELGWRQRETLNSNEVLTSPADYAKINISDVLNTQRFPTFAQKVIEGRVNFALSKSGQPNIKVQTLFPKLKGVDEAALLLGPEGRKKLIEELETSLDKGDFNKAISLNIGELFFIKYFSEQVEKNETFSSGVLSRLSNPNVWKDRVNNHLYASLFSIKQGKPGIRKYYCGWDTYLALANGNIRYLLELVHAALLRHLEKCSDDELGPISYEIQTKAAEDVGKKNLSELEGLSVDGAKLTKLLLSLGRIFQVMAGDPAGHTSEVTQFRLLDQPGEVDERVERLLKQAVMHLALVRKPGSKLTDETDTKDYDYMIHPIFAPFFVFSHRQKRKMSIPGERFLELVDSPRKAIKEVLERNNRKEEQPLPDQLQLFGSFYEEY